MAYKVVKIPPPPRQNNLDVGAWHRGDDCLMFPVKTNMDPLRDILFGWIPDNPFITRQHKIATFGSCFAHAIQNFLREKNYGIRPIYDCLITDHADGLVTSFTILQQFEYAYENKQFRESTWYYKPTLLAKTSQEDRINTRKFFDETDVFIITLGLSEIWFNKSDGEN